MELENITTIRNEVYDLLTSKEAFEKARGRHLLAEFLVEQYNFCSVLGEKYDEVYYYDEGIYKPGGSAIIKHQVEFILDDICTTTLTNEILNKIKRMTKIDKEELDNVDSNFICLNNGIYDLKNNKLINHSPQYKFLAKIKTNFVKNSECPNILKLFEQLISEKTLIDLQEVIGYCLYRSNSFKKAFIIEGPGDSGKTTVLNLLTTLIGVENISTSSLQYLCDNKNGTATLYGKMANFYDDLDVNEVKNAGLLKMITGNAYIPAEKKYMDQFTFKNKATLCFTCNKIPKTANPDITYYKRYILILFHNIIPVEEQIRDIELTLMDELPGLLKWSIEGLKRLINNNKFSYNWSPEQVQEYMQASCSSIGKFAQECLEEDITGYMDRPTLFKNYVNFCNKNSISGEEQKTMRDLGIHFLRYCSYAQDGRKNLPGHKNARVWKNIKLKDEFNLIEEVK